MSARKYRAFFCALGFVLFLTACGDLGMVLPSQGSYRVSARVTTPKDYDPDANPITETLDTYSIVNRKSKIQPYFVNSVAGDPDVQGLVVFVQDYSGKRVSRKVYYMLDSAGGGSQKSADDSKPPAVIPAETLPETPAGTETPAEADPAGAAGEVSPGDSPEGEAPMPGAVETAPAEFPETENNAWAGEPESSAELPPESSGAGFDAPAAEYTADSPADIFGGTGGDETGTETVAPPVEAETEIVPVEPEPPPVEIELPPVEPETPPVEIAVSPVEAEIPEAETGTGNSGAAEDTGTDVPGPDTIASSPDTTVPGPDTTVPSPDTTVPSLDTTVPETPPVVSPPEEPSDPVIPEDDIFLVKQLEDQYIRPFQITEDIAIGRYHLVFQVLGKGTEVSEKEVAGVIEKKVTEVILYKTFKPIYFLGAAKFTLEDIQSFLPMAVTGGRLIPMGINVMLKTEIKVEAAEGLDPYVIWYNGKKILAQGRMSGGADYLLWKTPEKTGFHNIRAEVFPLLSGERVPENMIGKIKELSLPVSSKSEGKKQFDEKSSGEFAGWYQLWGTLDDAKAPDSPQRRLTPLHAQPPRWIPFNGMYGLFVGQDDSYLLPGSPFKLARDEEGTGRMYFHLAALSGGSILSIHFAPQGQGDTADGTATLDLSLAGDTVILRIASEGVSPEEDEARVKLNSDELSEFITVVVGFVIAPDRFDAELRLENPAKTTELLSVGLAKPISGEGSILLGGGSGTMALNELAFSYVRQSVPENEENFDVGISESLLLEEEGPGAEEEPLSLSAL